MNDAQLKNDVAVAGFAVVDNVYTAEEIRSIISEIDRVDKSNATFRKTNDLFAIRQFLKEVPAVMPLIFNDKLLQLVKNVFDDGYFVVKSIYFDKPPGSNWFVPWHQDLTISVDKKIETPGFGPWTTKQNQFAVQPTLGVLEDNFTIRIHLDDTDEGNGALKVIEGSHLKGIYRPQTIEWDKEVPSVCGVKAGGIMIMRPLLLHASDRSADNRGRKVIHIEFSKAELPARLMWSEKLYLFN